jgi:hypothetical protein
MMKMLHAVLAGCVVESLGRAISGSPCVSAHAPRGHV